jgi:restriction system protein
MAEITRQRQGEMIEAVLSVLKDEPEGLPVRDVIERVRGILPPTEYELSDYPNSPGVQRFGNIIRFTTIAPVKAGWLVKNRGTWTITESGKAVIGRYADPAELMREAARLYRAWKKARPVEPDDNEEEGDDEETPSVALELAEESAWQEISSYLAEMPPYDFQQLVADLLEAMGYHIVWVAPPGPDQGVDVIAATDPLGASGPRIKVQVKRNQARVSVDGIRSFMAVLGANDIGLFVNTGGFTADAEREARNQETRRITLLSAQKLVDLWIEHYHDLPEQARQRLPLRPVYFLSPPE